MRIRVLTLVGILVVVSNAQIIWDTEIPISPVDGIPSYLSSNNARIIAVGQDRKIHVVWDEGRSPYPDVYWGVWYRSSEDGGNSWAPETCISFPLYYQNVVLDYANESPTIAMIEPGKVNVLWDGYDETYLYEFVFYFYSPDNGHTWEFGMNDQYWASDPPSGFNSLCSDGTNYLLFYDMQFVPQFLEYRLLGMASTDGGASWGGSANWHGSSTTGDGIPCTACDSNDTGYLVWPAVVTSNHLPVIMFGYASGGESQVVPYPGSGSRGDPFIESNLVGKLYLVWHDSRDGNSEIYFKKSTDGGTTWSTDQRLTNASGNSTEPAIVLGGPGKIYLVWIDTRDGNSEVYFKYSEDDGTTWSQDIRLTNDPGACSHTHIAISPDKQYLYVIWNDTRDGQEEVYFKRGTILIGISESSERGKENTTCFNIIPNPFHVKTEIRWHTSERVGSGEKRVASIKIYDARGRLVRDFSRLTVNGSRFTVITWDGSDDFGHQLPAGVYFVQFEAEDYKQTEKVILLR